MKKETLVWNIISHLVTAFISCVVFFILALIVQLWKIWATGENCPLAFIAACSIAVIFAVIGVLFACPLVICLQILRTKLKFSTWVPVVLVFPIFYTVLLALQFSVDEAPVHQVSFGVSLTLFMVFSVYWLALVLVNWTRRGISQTL